MWALVHYLLGTARLTITGVEPQRLLNRLTKRKIGFWKPVWQDTFTLEITILLKDMTAAVEIAAAVQCQCVHIKQKGIRQTFVGVLSRPVLWIAIVTAVVLPGILSQFIWTIDVSGNLSIPTEQILQELEAVGVKVGTYGPGIG